MGSRTGKGRISTVNNAGCEEDCADVIGDPGKRIFPRCKYRDNPFAPRPPPRDASIRPPEGGCGASRMSGSDSGGKPAFRAIYEFLSRFAHYPSRPRLPPPPPRSSPKSRLLLSQVQYIIQTLHFHRK